MFTWKDTYSVKINQLDDQHKRLLSIGQKATNLLNDFTGDKYQLIIEIIEELKEYTIFHFDYEEKLLKKHNYPSLEKHIKEHKVFINKLETIDLQVIEANQENAIRDILSFIAQWVFKHIMNTDNNYSDFLIAAMK